MTMPFPELSTIKTWWKAPIVLIYKHMPLTLEVLKILSGKSSAIKLPTTNYGSSYCFRHWHGNPRNVSSARKGSYPIIMVHRCGIFMLLNIAYSF